MAADARDGAASLRHLGRAVVRAAGAEEGRTHRLRCRRATLLERIEPHHGAAELWLVLKGQEPFGDDARDPGRGELALAREERLAREARPLGGRHVEEDARELFLDEGAFLLDDEQLLETPREPEGAFRLERPSERHLIDRKPQRLGARLVDAEEIQSLADV